ncbi:MAG: reverse transcriptase/maturase family protein [Lentisphaeria bacterium]|nr:reverse transcriptase/maturase family protein [Lentisphaeria bacterium]
MKRTGNLIEKIADMENLRQAFWKARIGKGGKREVRRFRENLDAELTVMRDALLDGMPSVGDYRYFTIHDPKERVICAASFRERVLHHAIMAVCDDTFEKYQIYDSYASRKGKGVDACLERTRMYCRRHAWFLKLDIHKFFDSIDHRTLMNLLARHFKDEKLLYMFSCIIDSYETAERKGVPIGNLTSQYFANMYLGMLDHQLKEVWRIPGYVRYMDDFILFADDRGTLMDLLPKIRSFLMDKLKLELNEPQLNKTDAGIPFLNYRVYGSKLRLSQKARRRFKRKIAIANNLEEPDLALPLLAFINRADSVAFRRAVILQGT